MPASEQIQLLQVIDIPGVYSETPQGDSGGLLRAELSRPFAMTLPVTSTITPYVFGALGVITRQEPAAGDPKRVNGTSFGAGLRYSVPLANQLFTAIDVTTEVSRVINDGNTPNYTALRLKAALRF